MNKFKFVLGCLSLSILLILTSCKIGLGSAVDTEAPEIEILNPAVGVVIRDSFSISGSWSDDGDIKDLKVKDAKKNGLTITLKRTDGTTSPTTFISTSMETPAFGEEKGKWTCVIDPTKAGENWVEGESTLLDGEYEAVVTITDTYEHKTEKTVTFTIDNTKPVVVLQRPSSREKDSPDSYGQSFTLEGQAADDNNVNKIEISIYSNPECTGEPLDVVTLNNVPPTISLDVAKYAENPVEKEELAYSKIYGSKPQGAKQLYCKIKAYDGSQRYPTDGTPQSAEDKNGNCTDYYYLYEEIATPVLSKFKITEVYQMYSGTYKGDEKDAPLRSANIDSVKDILEKDGAKITVGTFSLNPENNPTFTVSGKNPLKLDGHDFDNLSEVEIINGNKLQVEVSTGLDGIPIKGDTLGVYVKECDANGKATGTQKIVLVSPKVDVKGNAILTDPVKISERASLISKSGTSYKIAVTVDATITQGLSIGKKYIFGVDGYDENNSEVADFGRIFGFYLASSGSAPKVEVSSPANGISYNKKDSTMTVKGFTTTELSYPELTIKLTDAQGNEVHTQTYESVKISSGAYSNSEISTSNPNNKNRVDFTYVIPAEKFSQTTSAQYNLSVIASTGDKETTVERTILYDVDGPTASLDSMEPTAEKYLITDSLTQDNETGKKAEGSYLNGIVTLKLSITDAYDVVNVTDEATRPYFEVLDSSGKQIKVKYRYEISGGSSQWIDREKIFISTPAKQNFDIDTTSLGTGEVEIRIHAWDRAGNKCDVIEKKYVYNVDQTTDKPVVLPNSPDTFTFTLATKDEIEKNNASKKNLVGQGNQILLNLIDDDGINHVTVRRRDVKAEENYKNDENKPEDLNNLTTAFPVVVADENKSGKSISYPIPAPNVAGYYKYYIQVEDIKGNVTNVGPVDILVTSAAPYISSVTANPTHISKATSNNLDTNQKFTNTLEITSSEAPFYVFRKTSGEWDLKTGRDNEFTGNSHFVGKIASTGSDSYVWDDPTSLSPESTTTYDYIVLDRNYIESNTKSVLCTVDNNAPEGTLTNKKPGLTDLESYTFQGTAKDTGIGASGVKEVRIKVSGNGKTKTVTANGTSSWLYALNFNDSDTTDDNDILPTPTTTWKEIFETEGEKTILFTVVDNALNYCDLETITFNYDKSVPTLTAALNPASYAKKDETVKVDIGAYDTNKLVKIEIKDGDTVLKTITEGLSTAKDEASKYTANETITLLDGTHTITVIATDDATRTTVKSETIMVDTVLPELTVSTIDSYKTVNSYEFKGNASDSNLTKVIAYLQKKTAGSFVDVEGKSSVVDVDPAGNWSWKVYDLEDAEYRVRAVAEDKVGNTYEVNSGDTGVIIDTKDPVITVSDLIENSTYYYKNASSDKYTVSGTILEADGLSTFTVKVGEAPEDKIFDSIPAGSATAQNWSKEVTITAGNIVPIVISAKDKAGRTVSKTYNICNDTVAPTMEITNPDSDISGNSSLSGSKYTFRFAASDSGSGVDKFKYFFTDTKIVTDATNDTLEKAIIAAATSSDAETKGWITKTGDGAIQEYKLAKGKTPASPESDTIYEGQHYIYLYGIDKSGNEAGVERSYWVDKESPSLEETTVDTTGTTVLKGKSLTFGGTVSDVNGITSLVIKDDITGKEWSVDLSTLGDCTTSTTWTITITCSEGELIDGKHSLTITAKDGAEKETVLTRTVTVDTKVPKTNGFTVESTPDWTSSDSDPKKWFKSQTVSVKVASVSDPVFTKDTYEYASGVSDVQYSVDNCTSWISMTKSSDGKDWTASVYCADQGLNTIQARVLDKAGNSSAILSQAVYIDTVKPAAPTAYSVDGEASKVGSKLINGRNPVSMSITVDDALKDGITDETTKTGIDKIVYKGKTDYTFECGETNLQTFDIPVPNLKDGQVTFYIYDKVGNYTEWSPFSFTKDTVSPTITITSPKDADTDTDGVQVNGTISLSGTSQDTGGATVETIDIVYYLNSEWKHLAHLEATTDKPLSTWEVASIDTTTAFGTIADGTTINLCAIVSDSAGNRNLDTKSGEDVTDNTELISETENRIPKSTVTEASIPETDKIALVVNQDTDRPVITFSTLDFSDSTVWLKNQTKVVGTISDDDGINEDTFKVSLTESQNENDWKKITIANGSWSFDIADFYEGQGDVEEKSNGVKTLYFKVSDINSNSFVSKASGETASDSIYLKAGTIKKGELNPSDKTKLNSATSLTLTVDTLPPAVEITGVKIDGDADFTTSASSLKFGGTKDKFILKVSARDGVGLKDSNPITATASFKSGTTTVTSVDATVAAESGVENSYLLTFALSNANKTALLNAKYDDNAEIKVTVEDKAGNKQNATANLSADFKKPEITISAPSSTQYSSGNITAYGTIDSTTTMYYAVSLDDTTTPGADASHLGTAITSWKKLDGTTGTGSVNVKPYFTQINGNSLQWFVYFDDGATTNTATHDVSFKKYLVNYGITTEAAIADKSFKDVVQLYLWVKAVDESGNETVEKYLVLVDPQGDAPKVTIDYPEEDGTTLGGTVTLRGTATDTIGNNIGVDSVWLQIIPNSDGTTFAPTMNDVKLWVDNGYDVYQNTSGNKITSVTGSTASGANYYIKATFSGSAWNLKINGESEFNPASGSTKNIAYRIYAKDKDGNLSNYEQQYSIFDSDNPVISDLYLRQYENNDTGDGTVVASQAYEDDMWVKGTWWLCGIVQDTQGLSSLTVDGNAQTIKGTENAEEEFKYKLETGGTDNAGSVSVTIEAQDKVDQGATPHKAERTLTINFDNKAPELITSGSAYKIDSAVRNSNGFYSFGSQVTEDAVSGSAQSGFSYLAFWFERNISGGKHVVYDVMRSKSNSEVTYSGLTEENGLMWKSKTVTRDDSALGTLEVSAKDDNIHVGGLCKIGGTIYIISSVSSDGTTININGQPEKSYTTALFAIANVVDNTIESARGTKSSEDGQYGYYTTISNDDGDHMVESVEKSGTTWTWEANINSQNIADGTVTLHYVAFDKAGNYKDGTVSGNVENNAPRLASLKVWSDFNENETEEEGESETYYYMEKEYKIGDKYQNRASEITKELIVSGNKKDYNDGGSAFMTIKAATTFTPEIVGGNGALYYSYKNGASSALSSATVKYGDSTIGNGTDSGIDEEIDNTGYLLESANGLGYINGNTTCSIPLSDLASLPNSASATDPTWFEYTIYDSTEGSSSTWNSTTHDITGRLSAKFRVALNVQYNDTTRPQAWITPFYWNSKTENSISWSADGVAEGHIELEGDLTDAITTALGDDPKVSGKIVVTGYAEDDIKLSELYVQFSNHTNLSTAQKASTYNSGTWSTRDFSDGWGFSAEDVYCNGDGHKVKWTLTVDTAARTTKAQLDQAIVVYAKDARNPKESEHTTTIQTKTDAETCYYKMDIVPYIAKVYTNLAKHKAGNWSVYARTALGHYSVADNETAYLYGFNLGDGTDKPKYGDTTLNAPAEGSTTNQNYPSGTDYANYQVVTFPVSNVTTSGQIALTVNGVSTLNNMNKNEASGSSGKTISNVAGGSSTSDKQIYAYNLQPNADNNNLLTDDIVFDVWQMNSEFAKPTDGALSDPVMKINPYNNIVGFAFVSGTSMFCMPNSRTSYTTWQKSYDNYNSIGLAYDKNGVSYGVAAGADCNDHQADLFNFMTSRWGTADTAAKGGSTNGTRALRLESIGQSFDKNGNRTHDEIWGGPDELFIDKKRIQSPSIATFVNGNSTNTTVYLAYYDNINDEIRFRQGTFTNGSYDRTGNKQTNGTLTDDWTGNEFAKSNTPKGPNDGFYYTNKSQIVATATGTGVLGQAGNYVSIGVTSNNVVVMVWYDQWNKKLCYAYNTTPTTSRTGVNSTGWTKGPDILSSGGEYCQIAVDANNGIHIAAYDNGNLMYAHLDSYNSTTVESCVVDSYDIIGQNLTLDVAKVGDDYIPYIGYYALSRTLPKYAYLAQPGEFGSDGADSTDCFTGVWESTYIPTTRSIPQDRINVGVFKTAAGVKTYSTKDKLAPITGNVGTVTANEGSGTCYGNGTSNPILGYVNKYSSSSSFIETAQMK